MKCLCQSLSKYRYRESITTIACRLSLIWACHPYDFIVPWVTSVTAMFLLFTMEPSSWQTHLNLHRLLSYSILFILTRIYIALLCEASDYLKVAREFHLLHVIIFLTAKLTVLLLMRDYMHKNASSLPFCIPFDFAPFPSLTLLSSFRPLCRIAQSTSVMLMCFPWSEIYCMKIFCMLLACRSLIPNVLFSSILIKLTLSKFNKEDL